MSSQVRKRQRHETSSYADVTYPADVDQLPHEHETILGENPMFAVHDSFTTGICLVRDELDHAAAENNRKRGHNQVDDHNGDATDENQFLSAEAQRWLQEAFPEFYPAVPSLDDRRVELNIPNPFPKDGEARHSKLRDKKSAMFADGAVNGLIKFHMGSGQGVSQEPNNALSSQFAQSQMGMHHRRNPNFRPHDGVPPLPPGFGRDGKLKLDQTDNKLMTFYLVAFCSGRTLLPHSNGFYCDIAPMVVENECVRHALLTLAATYVLDYLPSDKLRARANYHYSKAVALLDEGINTPENHEVGKEEAIIGALVLLNCDDLVNWELHQPRNCEPKWYKGARTAKLVLDNSDPGYRYWKAENVQSSNARVSCGNKVASYDIFSQTVMPLEKEESDASYSWLLTGTERDVRKIHGLTGLSSKLLHTFAQITHLAAQLQQNPTSIVIPLGAKKLETRLSNFQQWSELSEGHATIEDLLAGCTLDDKGEVDSPATITELIAASYTACALVYLHCRLFRKPRRHPDVQAARKVIITCLQRMPVSGGLYTAQHPLFSMFIGGLVAYEDEDRKIIRGLFENIVSGTRGNVPPAWRGLSSIWERIDTEQYDAEEYDEEQSFGLRTAWWEDVTAELKLREGRLNLA